MGKESKPVSAKRQDGDIGKPQQQRFEKVVPAADSENFANFQILEKIGRGSMGTVYKALCIPTGQEVALKIILSQNIEDEKRLERLRQEIAVHKTLHHPHIIKLYGAGLSPDGIFIVMEYVNGYTLDHYVEKYGKLETLEALETTRQILQALYHAHQNSIIHRDLKPANILLVHGSSRVKIADFGLAKFTDEQSLGISATSDLLGTPAYMAPEQIICSKRVDIRADIYALGCLLYFMIFGRRPYSHIKSPSRLIYNKAKMIIDPASTVDTDVAVQLLPEVRNILLKAMQMKPEDRYASPQELMDVLAEVIETLQKQYQRQEIEGERQTRASRFFVCQEEGKKWLLANVHLPDPMTETFISSSDWQTSDPVMQSFQQELETIVQSPEATEEAESELLFATIASSEVTPWQQIENTLHREMPAKDLLQAINVALKADDLAQQQKTIRDLKYSLLRCGKQLTHPDTIVQIINDGKEPIRLQIVKLSDITPSPNLNNEIARYLTALVECRLREHHTVFIRGLESCLNVYQIDSFLENYPLPSQSTVNSYRELRIIKTVKAIKKEWDDSPARLTAILDKYLASRQPIVRAVFEKLAAQDSGYTLLDLSLEEKELSGLLTALQSYDKHPQARKMAQTIHRIVSAFITSKSRASLRELKVALNFIPVLLRNKICVLARRHLWQELQIKLNELFHRESTETKKLTELLAILKNPRYSYPTITPSGYPTEDLAQRIEEVCFNGMPINQAFPQGNLPKSLKKLLQSQIFPIKSESTTVSPDAASSPSDKNRHNCLRRLRRLAEHTSTAALLPYLIKLFRSYGPVNFASDNRAYLSGYQIAQHIIHFYRDPKLKEISLPAELTPEIGDPITKIANEQRAKQYEKDKGDDRAS